MNIKANVELIAVLHAVALLGLLQHDQMPADEIRVCATAQIIVLESDPAHSAVHQGQLDFLRVRSEPLGSTPKLPDPSTWTRCAMSDPRDWRTLFAAAMLEGDSTQLPSRIERAEETIQVRLRELPETFSVGSEQAELQSALRNVRLWRCRILRIRDSEGRSA